MTCSNIWRHNARRHGNENNQQRIRDSSLESLASRDVSVTRSSDKGEADQVVDLESIRSAALCMLRRVEGVNIPNLTRYLEIHFPGIPATFREPLIACTFSVAQKCSAVYVDTLMGDSARSEWAKRSLSRWLHGVSAVEPGSRSSEEEFDEEPRFNSLSDKELPVSFESAYAQTDMEAAFKAAEREQEGTGLTSVVPVTVSEDANDVEPDDNPMQSDISAMRKLLTDFGSELAMEAQKKSEIVSSSEPEASTSDQFKALDFTDLELELPDDPLLTEIPALLTPIHEQQKENLPQNGSVSCLQKAYDITKYKVKKATTKRSSDSISATAAAAEEKVKVFETTSRPVGKIPLKSKQISDEHDSEEFLPCKKKSFSDDSRVKPRSQVKKVPESRRRQEKYVDRRDVSPSIRTSRDFGPYRRRFPPFPYQMYDNPQAQWRRQMYRRW